MEFKTNREFALSLDGSDSLAKFRDRFIRPGTEQEHKIYFLGNSLGLQPASAKQYMQAILDDWANWGVEGFFHSKDPWMHYHDHLVRPLTRIVGALPEEIVVMNQLTVNLHLLLVSFYRPTSQRYRIICEAKAFPSDQYAFETHVCHHGYDPHESIVEVSPREGEKTLRTEDILSVIRKYGDETALVLFGGINYYTGQLFDLPAIASAASKAGAMVGFDLAHAAGNVPLQLHDWDVDFACWCSYKYLNSGPGAIAGAFIHEKHHEAGLERFAGWWGYDKSTRFKMDKGFKPIHGAEGWQLSTPSILLYACHRAALEIFEEAGWNAIQDKRRRLNDYLWFLLHDFNQRHPNKIEFITPDDPGSRGCQVSMLMLDRGREIYDALTTAGIMVDWREPNVIRLAPVPLYNTYDEIWRFADKLQGLFK